ncbi:MAG: S-methyl-5-thioribose-1-phosphate isomerase [Nevskiales bacterium]
MPQAATQNLITPLIWEQTQLRLLDQRKLPLEEVYLEARSAHEVAQYIHDMVVRGAPAIGIAAAYGVALAARHGEDMAAALKLLAASRPTAVNLHWALARMQKKIQAGADAPALAAEAEAIHAEDLAMNQRIGTLGAALFEQPVSVLTHCNTGALATGGWGTALGVIRSAHAAGKLKQVFAGETRPWLQGARLTAWELLKDGIPAQLVVDSAAASLMAQGQIDWVIVGADRVVANGDVANKIGTYGLAVLAREHGVKFMVAAPSSTLDMSLQSGAQIPIEERPGAEIGSIQGRAIAPADFPALNPVFDVTPARLVDALVTEKGVLQPPTQAGLKKLLDA